MASVTGVSTADTLGGGPNVTGGGSGRFADRIFKGVGNETSGTLHVDMRPGPIARFVSWTAGR